MQVMNNIKGIDSERNETQLPSLLKEERVHTNMQVHEQEYKQVEEEMNNGSKDQWRGSNFDHTNSILGSEMTRMILKEGEEDNRVMTTKPIWVESDGHGFLDVNEEGSIFYDNFPSLPDIPCPSSSSSSSMPTCSSSSFSCSVSSSSTSSWAMIKTDNEDGVDDNHHHRFHQEAKTEANQINPHGPDQNMGIDVLEGIGAMDLLDSSSIWDPSCLFPCDTDEEEDNHHLHRHNQQEKEQELHEQQNLQEEQPSEDLAMVFFEWLKSNKESICPEDLRSIKLKKSTIECAVHRLGGGKEGIMQLLKLILAWVQNHHLQKRKNREEENIVYHHRYPQAFPFQAPLVNNPSFPCSNSWVPQSPYIIDPTAPPSFPTPSPMGYMDDSMFYNAHHNHYPFSSTSDCQMIDSTTSWPTQFPQYNNFSDPSSTPFLGFSNRNNDYGGGAGGQMYRGMTGRLVKMAPSATKEARKKRMARQRRLFYHHHRHHQNQNLNNQKHQQLLQHQNFASMDQTMLQSSRLPNNGNCNSTTDSNNWVMWSSVSSSSSSSSLPPAFLPIDPTSMQQQERQFSVDKRQFLQGGKPDKNLRFLLQKVLKQSDVGNLGRIVLPKKEAETHLPELVSRDGISIAMEDIGTSRVWNMRYRFWPNNKSRMYLLENTGDFVRANGLQEGDFIVIYSDSKCTKYMIRGVKVRKQESKLEGRNPGKVQRNTSNVPSSSNYEGSSSSFPIMQVATA